MERALVRLAVDITDASFAYLVLFMPEPVIVCLYDGGSIIGTVGGNQAGAQADVPLEARDFWSGLMDGELYVLAEAGNADWPSCACPVDGAEITRHMAVGMMTGRAPDVILGVANAPFRFTKQDALRLQTLLTVAWESVLLRKRLEEKEREAELHRSLLHAAPVGLALLNFHGELLSATPAFKSLYGLNEYYRVSSVFSLVRPDKRYVLEDAIAQVMHVGGEPLQLEMEHMRGEEEFMAAVTLARLETGGVNRLLMMVNDVSESSGARRQLEQHRDKLEKMVMDRTVELQNALVFAESTRDRIDMILRSIADGLLVTDMHNRIILMNSNAEKFLGVGLQDAVGMQIGQALGMKPFRAAVEEHVARTRNGEAQMFEFVATAGEGTDRYIRAGASQVVDKHGLPAGVVTIMHDASKERELDILKSEFLSMAAHELRTPLTTIQGFSDLLMNRRDLSEEESRHFLELVNQNAQALSGIVSGLLDISRIESGRGFVMYYETLDMAELVRSYVDSRIANSAGSPQDAGSRHSFSYSGPPSGVLAHADRAKCLQIMENLVGNAVKYSPQGGEISVRLEADAAGILVCVRDEGMGMTREQTDRAFEKFFRAHSDGGIQGTGLGLPIVKHFVEAHGGEVWIESEPGAGTRVTFTMPTAEVAKARLYTATG